MMQYKTLLPNVSPNISPNISPDISLGKAAVSIALVLLLSACGSDDRTAGPDSGNNGENGLDVPVATDDTDSPEVTAQVTPENTDPAAPEGADPASPEVSDAADDSEIAIVPAPPVELPATPQVNPDEPFAASTIPSNDTVNAGFRIELSANQFSATEGGDPASVVLTIDRLNGHVAPVRLAISGNSLTDNANASVVISDEILTGDENSSNFAIGVSIARGPILAQTRQFNLIATDSGGVSLTMPITVAISPTSAPDVYLQIGQSNMVGSSLFNARQAQPGQLDAPDDRIMQLNVTGNDTTNFPSEAAFSNAANVANSDAPISTALDPLHDGFNFAINGKVGTQVGMGLSFARSMLPNTTANIVLVPAAWSDSGFCQTESIPFPTVGWLASPPTDQVNFSGTLLHDRALTRLNLALQESGGIFRGILWHQGEADSSNLVCSAAYEANLTSMVASIRTRAQVDARGEQARGAAADVPFVAGTMSQGGVFAEFSEPRAQVEGVHRAISNIIPFSATVINDDLVPPAFPCGLGSCIHFGATAYREIGNRYAGQMLDIQSR